MIKIVTDTTCDLPPAWLRRYDLTRIPINIQFGQESFQEGLSLTTDTFYRRIENDGRLPTTSQPAVGEFVSLYERLAAGGNDILSIHVTSKLSGTWQTAHLSARQVAGRINVTVVDSLTGSVGLGLMVHEAACLAEAGWPAPKIAAHLQTRPPAIFEVFMLDDLRHARMSGRVGRFRETVVSLLRIKPLVGVEAGALVPLDRVRTRSRALTRMVELAAAAVGEQPVHVGVVHALAKPQAEALLAQAQSRLTCRETFITDLSLSLAVHFGPGTIGLAAYPAT